MYACVYMYIYICVCVCAMCVDMRAYIASQNSFLGTKTTELRPMDTSPVGTRNFAGAVPSGLGSRHLPNHEPLGGISLAMLMTMMVIMMVFSMKIPNSS